MCDDLLVTVAVLKSVNGHIFCKNVEKTTTEREKKVKNKEVINSRYIAGARSNLRDPLTIRV